MSFFSCSHNLVNEKKQYLYVHDEVEYNFLIYMAGDNNLERFGIQNIKSLQEIGSSEKCNILVLFDRSGGYDRTEGNWSNTKLFLISKNPTHMNDDSILSFEELDMTNVNTLYNFLELTNRYFPAKHTILDIWSHGRGVYPDGIISRSVIEDYTTGYGATKMMTICNLARCIKEYEDNYMKKIDVIIFDACYMQMIEICYQLRNLTDYIIGAETAIPGVGSNYKEIANFINNNEFSIRELSEFLVKSTSASNIGYSYSGVETCQLDNFMISFNYFCEELMKSSTNREVKELRQKMTNIASIYPEFMDLYEFISFFDTINGQTQLQNRLSKLIINSNATGSFEHKTKGLGINFPYEESEILYYKSQNQNYEILDFYKDSLFDEFLLEFWSYL